MYSIFNLLIRTDSLDYAIYDGGISGLGQLHIIQEITSASIQVSLCCGKQSQMIYKKMYNEENLEVVG